MKHFVYILTILIIGFSLHSCNMGDFEVSAAKESQEEVMIINQIEIAMNSLRLIVFEVDKITEKIAKGEKPDVELKGSVDNPTGWEYDFNTNLLEGRVSVDFSGEPLLRAGAVQTVNCSGLRIKYHGNNRLNLFGSFSNTNISTSANNQKHKILSSDFACGIQEAEITIKPNYVLETSRFGDNLYEFKLSGQATGISSYYGDFTQEILTPLLEKSDKFYFLDGNMLIKASTITGGSEIGVTYTDINRTITHKGNTYITHYIL